MLHPDTDVITGAAYDKVAVREVCSLTVTTNAALGFTPSPAVHSKYVLFKFDTLEHAFGMLSMETETPTDDEPKLRPVTATAPPLVETALGETPSTTGDEKRKAVEVVD